MNILIRDETPDDIDSIDNVVRDAFDNNEEEPQLVRLIRERRQSLISMVAVDGADIVGHVMVSPIELSTTSSYEFGGVAPLSVSPQRQRSGIGGLLMKAMIEESANINLAALFLLGNPAYYQRFGFVASHIGNEYGATDAFMHLELLTECLAGQSGTAKYVKAFQDAGA